MSTAVTRPGAYPPNTTAAAETSRVQAGLEPRARWAGAGYGAQETRRLTQLASSTWYSYQLALLGWGVPIQRPK
jgi:hypothetical protein